MNEQSKRITSQQSRFTTNIRSVERSQNGQSHSSQSPYRSANNNQVINTQSVTYQTFGGQGNGHQAGQLLSNSNHHRTQHYQSSSSQRRITGNEYEVNQSRQKLVSDLEWQDPNKLIINGETQFSSLKHTKNLLLQLISQFNTHQRVVFEGDLKEDFNKRLILMENELEGTMKRMIHYNVSDPNGGTRTLDYSKLLNEKQNTLVERDKKIQNLEERLRRANEREIQLELAIQRLSETVSHRNSQIQESKRLLQVREEAIGKIKTASGVSNQPEIKEILKYLKLNEENLEAYSQNNDLKNSLAQLEREINRIKSKSSSSLLDLESSLQTYILSLPNNSNLRLKLEAGDLRRREDESYRTMDDKFKFASEIYKKQIDKIRRDNPNMKINYDDQMLDVLRSTSTKVSNINGILEIERQIKVTKEVPVQDARTKHLIHAFAVHLKKLHEKYPKLKQEIDPKLSEFITDEIIQMIQVDELDSIVDIVKYVPQVVKVQNVYSYNSQKSRKVQFHLRVLIKALIEELEKAQRKSGIVLEIDQGVIGLIKNQIMDVVDVDDILKVYRTVPKIVEVQKVVEKVVDNIVRVPEKFMLNNLQSQAVSLQKPNFAADEKVLVVNADRPVPMYRDKPVEMQNLLEKVVSHPEVRQRVAIETREKTNVLPQDRIVERIVEVQKPVYIEKDKIIIQKQLQEIEVIKEVVRYIETEKEIIKPVDRVVEKIVEKIIEKQRLVPVTQIVQKIVQTVRYIEVQTKVPYVETEVKIVKEIHQKIVPIIHREEVIKIQPQIVEKIVTVQKIIERPPRQIQVIKEVLAVMKEVQIRQIVVPKIIIQKEIEIRQIEKRIEVPIIVPQIRVEKEIHQVPMIETIERITHIPVEVIRNIIMQQQKPVEVMRNVPYIMREEMPLIMQSEKVIPFEVFIERIKEIMTTKEKIIQKIVEVPKVVEVEKIVERIVIVPRIIEKIVEVPQIIEKIVEKIIEVPVQMPPVTHYVEKPCRVEIPVEVEREKIVYITVDRPVEIKGDTIFKKDLETKTNIQIEQIIQERICVIKEEVPVEMVVEKVVAYPVIQKEIEFVDKILVKPIQIPVPIQIEKMVPIYINTDRVQVKEVPQIIQRFVEKQVFREKQKIIPEIQQKVAVEQRFQFEQVDKFVKDIEWREVPVIHEKICEARTFVDQIKEIQLVVEKLIPCIEEVPKIYEFEKEPKIIYPPPQIQIVEKITPMIINVNKYIQKIVQKLIEVPHLLREVNVVKEIHEKNIAGPERTNTVLKTVEVAYEKQLIRQKQKIITEKVHMIQQVLKIVSEITQKDRDPVIITRDRIIEVPHVLEKIVEKIVIMPQVVEVLKYVHEIMQTEDLGVSLDIGVQAKQYKVLGEQLERNIGQFLIELNRLKSLQPNSAAKIASIEDYLAKFRRFIKYPRIHQIIKEKIVEKQKNSIVRVSGGKTDTRQELARILLIEKLISQISRIKRSNPNINIELDDDIKFIFGLNFEGKVKDINERLSSQMKDFENSLEKRFSKMGGWTMDHQQMLKSFLEERFVLANIVKSSNSEIKIAKKQNQQLVQEIAKAKALTSTMYKALLENKNLMPSITKIIDRSNDSSLSLAYTLLTKQFDEVLVHLDNFDHDGFEPTKYLGKKFIEDFVSSALREKQREIELLREKLRNSKFRADDHAHCNATITNLEYEIKKLTRMLEEQPNATNASQTKSTIRSLEVQIERLTKIIHQTNSKSQISSSNQNDTRVRSLETEIQRLTRRLTENSSHDSCNHQIKNYQIEIKKLNLQMESYLSRISQADKEIHYYRSELAQFQHANSPKNSIGTRNSLTSPQEVHVKKSIIISQVSRERSEGDEEYGQNYHEYMQGGQNYQVGTIGYQDRGGQFYQQSSYRSGVQPRDLTNSDVASIRSGHLITTNEVNRNRGQNNIESARYIQQGANIESSSRYLQQGGQSKQFSQVTSLSQQNQGTKETKKYAYYQKKYEQHES